ncbi:MAG TPA: zinc ribbon domain-containing protein [Acidobacteria bacterium]|nr:zinc ribbon domain-containing protein [Acidobacteriota bacterium]
MAGLVAFDIYLLGLKDPSREKLDQLVDDVARLTRRQPDDIRASLRQRGQPLFAGISLDRAKSVVDTLDTAGALLEIRPVVSPLSAEGSGRTVQCPRCHFEVPGDAVECPKCGLVFAKWEREQIRKMQREQQLEEALTKVLQVRQEWDQRAKVYLERHPFPEDAAAPFAQRMFQEEVPFQRLESDEGPILMTSRRMLILQGKDAILSIPYEMISDVDVGGGLVKKKDRVNMKLTFHGPVLIGEKPTTSVNFSLDKESSFYKDVVMDWAFARNFICGSCGARDLEFRLEGTVPHYRCMHCATDHEIDLNEAVAIPILHD